MAIAARGKRRGFVTRLRVLSGVFVCVALLLVVRLYFVQIVHGDAYRSAASAEYVETSSEMSARNDIFFTTKDGRLVGAAVMTSGWRIALTPKDVVSATSTYAAIAAITPIDRERFFASAAKKTDPYEEVAFRLDDDTAGKVRALKLPGVLLVRDEWRNYPAKSLAAHTLGFVGYRGESDRKVGLYGLEKYWNDALEQNGNGLYVNPFAEIFANVASLVDTDPGAEHGSIITSIEPNVQRSLDDALTKVMQTYTPRMAGGIVMDPNTGAILALASKPDFDPNAYNLAPDAGVFTDPMVERVYEMGSILKPITMASAIDAGAVTPATTYNDTGCIKRSGATICNFDGKARGVVSMQEVLNQSLNVGATFAAERLGHTGLAKYFNAFGFGEETGIDLPGEVGGKIRNLDNGADVDYASASFGQGISVTPIEMTRALASLGNGGFLPDPHVAVGIRYENGIVRSIVPAKPPGGDRRVISTTTSETISTMLSTVFDKALLNGELRMDHHTVASKTGTAQIAIPGGGGYYKDRYLHSFFGYFPAHDPKFIVFLYTVEPHGEEYASHTLVHPFADVAKFIINYYNLPPDR